jgi:hypothetical protein
MEGGGVLAGMRQQRLRIPTVVLTSLDDETLDHRLTTMGASAIFRKYELIQPSANGALAVVKRILAPILTSGDQQASSTAPPSA